MGSSSLHGSRSILLLLLLTTISSLCLTSAQLSPSQSKTLLRLQSILEYPPALAAWSNATVFCYLPPSPSVTVTCSGNRVTELIIVGDAARAAPLSPGFSSDSLFTTLSRLPSLTTLSLVSLGLWGPLPGKVDRFDALRVLNLSSNHFSGAVPPEISTMTSLQNLVLSWNSFNGSVPDLKSLSSLAQVDLSGNHLGPDFPSLSAGVAAVLLRNNSFQGEIPAGIASFDQLQKLDLSYDSLSGRIPAFLFSLKSIQYLSVSGNKLTGEVPAGAACSSGLGYVDISNNLLVGQLPSCVSSNSSSRVVLASGNCLSSGSPGLQRASSYCNNAALAAVLPPANRIGGSKSNLGLIVGIVGGVVAATVLAGLVALLALRRARAEDAEDHIVPKPNAGVSSVQVAPRTPVDAMRIETFGLTPYRVFTLEEVEEATNSFEQSNLIEDGPGGQFYKGWLEDGSMVLVRCLKLKQKLSHQSLLQYMDIISMLRHRHLVSILGHCICSSQQDANNAAAASGTTIFLVSEYVNNGTLRSHLTEWRKREMLKWPQRVAAVIGVARGVQFLHTVSVPGIVGNDLNIENILLDKTLTAKISNYNLPVLPRTKSNKMGSESPFFGLLEDGDIGSIQSLEMGEKEDIYQLGLILLEVITGKPAGSKKEVDSLRKQLQKCLPDNAASLKETADAAIRGTFAIDSLRTAVELALNCVSEDPNARPSVDDVLWNLQYSVQIQDGWASSENLSVQT